MSENFKLRSDNFSAPDELPRMLLTVVGVVAGTLLADIAWGALPGIGVVARDASLMFHLIIWCGIAAGITIFSSRFDNVAAAAMVALAGLGVGASFWGGASATILLLQAVSSGSLWPVLLVTGGAAAAAPVMWGSILLARRRMAARRDPAIEAKRRQYEWKPPRWWHPLAGGLVATAIVTGGYTFGSGRLDFTVSSLAAFPTMFLIFGCRPLTLREWLVTGAAILAVTGLTIAGFLAMVQLAGHMDGNGDSHGLAYLVAGILPGLLAAVFAVFSLGRRPVPPGDAGGGA